MEVIQELCFRFEEWLMSSSVRSQGRFRCLQPLFRMVASALSPRLKVSVLCLVECVFVVAAPHPGECNESAAARDTQRQMVEFVIAGIKDRIDQISSGEVVVKLRRSPNLDLMADRSRWIKDSDYRYLFDYRSGNILFDHESFSSANGQRRYKTLLTDKANYFYEQPRQDAGTVVIRSKTTTAPVTEALPIDFRLAGIVGWGEISSQYTLEKCKEDFWLNPALFQRVAANRNGLNGLTELNLVHIDSTGGEWQIVAKIDEKRQYVPTEVRRYFRSPHTQESQEDDSPSPSNTIITTWETVSGIWVPVTWTITRGLEPPVEFSFEWKRLNCDFDPKEFSLEGMQLPDGTMIVNSLGATPIVEGVTGEKVELVAKETTTRKFHTTRWLLLSNLLVMAAIAVLYVYKRYSQR